MNVQALNEENGEGKEDREQQRDEGRKKGVASGLASQDKSKAVGLMSVSADASSTLQTDMDQGHSCYL